MLNLKKQISREDLFLLKLLLDNELRILGLLFHPKLQNTPLKQNS